MPMIMGDWQLDNFYQKEVRSNDNIMSSPKNLQDCYFYYYSVCRKGTSCPYRHEPSALGHERVCPKWTENQCFQPNCPDRHMVIEKARNQIQCYWENKGGCRKPHCVFKHLNSVQPPPNTSGLMTTVNPNVVATALIQMQQHQRLQHHIQQAQTNNNSLDQTLIDK
ncbi:zinc finger CCCH domain-containing protein 11A-like isoform X2 [Sitodiplosis mosellana]|uniref:zinc finger CCCH domain-containing protein 11A-like isoform X2 n=1 Tax=Sitodiplosis mosellana TaxID=263140 RepID=UPI0024451318|nr:zinc finger CCCH domain-containing protein 11A-like isoform X2 [Sitodiplosis mosellana]XP_055312940.1 zinc finger CCCH domain-containing protein 11A-like isoform X2 [Sitodiplosis mosellana]